MNDTKNEFQVNINADYAGPPKSHDFQSNPSGMPVGQFAPPPKIQMPEKTPENVQLNEADILATPPAINNTETDNELLRMIERSGEIEATKNKKKVKVKTKKEPLFDLKKLDISKEWFEFRKKIIETKRKYKKAIQAFNLLWGITKFSFYCVGLSFFALCSFIYFSFEPLVQSYLDKHKLSNISFDSISYSLSELTLKNVKEKNGLFTIGSVNVHYTFADLLDKKIPSVIIDSMKIYLQEEADGKNTAQSFITTLWNSGLLEQNSLFTIQSLRLENSVLYVGNKEYKLPVNFSGVGSLGAKKHLEFPITLNNDYLSLKANIKLDLSYMASEWTMEILEGSLYLPGFELQTLKGNASLKTRRGNLTSLTFVGSLTNEGRKKDLDIQIIPSSGQRASLKLTYTIPDKPRTIYSLNLSNIVLATDLRSFESRSPMFFKVTNIGSEELKADTIQISANGLFKCDSNGCFYRLQKRSDLIMFNPSYNFYDTDFSIVYPLRLTIEPNDDYTVRYKDKKIDVNLIVNRSIFDLRKKSGNSTPESIEVNLNESVIKSSFDLEKKEWTSDFDLFLSKIDAPFAFSADTKVKGSLSKDGFIGKINTPKIKLKTFPYFKPEVSLDMSVTTDDYFVATIESENKQISASVNGYYHPYTGEILMALQTNKPIVFKKSLLSPNEVSGMFSPDLKEATGSVSVKGEVHYKGNRAISGPLKVKIDDASFSFGNTKVKNLNTVLNITQLVPFGAQGIQNIYAEELTNAMPFENVHAQVLFDSNRKQFNISSLTTDIAGYRLAIEPMWYNYGAPIYNFTLKGKTEPIQKIIDNTTLKNLQIKGNGSISVSTQLEEDKMTLKSCELSIPNDGYITYTPKVYPNPYLENLKYLDFRRLSIYLTEQDEKVELIFSGDNKSNKLRKKTNFRFTIKEPLEKYIVPQKWTLPDMIADEKENF